MKAQGHICYFSDSYLVVYHVNFAIYFASFRFLRSGIGTRYYLNLRKCRFERSRDHDAFLLGCLHRPRVPVLRGFSLEAHKMMVFSLSI